MTMVSPAVTLVFTVGVTILMLTVVTFRTMSALNRSISEPPNVLVAVALIFNDGAVSTDVYGTKYFMA